MRDEQPPSHFGRVIHGRMVVIRVRMRDQEGEKGLQAPTGVNEARPIALDSAKTMGRAQSPYPPA